jgi:hypothetical protein
MIKYIIFIALFIAFGFFFLLKDIKAGENIWGRVDPLSNFAWFFCLLSSLVFVILAVLDYCGFMV